MYRVLPKIVIALFFIFSFKITYVIAANINEEQLLKDYVTNLIDDGYKLFNDNQITSLERNKKIKKLLQDNLHLEWMANYSLGRHRRTLSKNKINEFVEVYSKFVVKAYVDLTQHYKGEKAKLKAVKQFDDDMFLVYMEILKPGTNSPIRVDYLVHQVEDGKNNRFRVADIITEGISILNSQQAEFNNIISNQGIDALIEDLQEKISGNPGELKKIRY